MYRFEFELNSVCYYVIGIKLMEILLTYKPWNRVYFIESKTIISGNTIAKYMRIQNVYSLQKYYYCYDVWQ